MIAKPFTRDI